MQILTTLVLAALGQSAFAARSYSPLAVSQRSDISKRLPLPAAQGDGLTCEETYGPGSMACGKPELKLCFNPGKGESCCGMDGGFCEAGFQCAPVSKFCCKIGEDIDTCAANAGFEVPAVESPPDNGTTTASASATVRASILGNSTTTSRLLFNNSTLLSLPTIVAVATEDCATTVTVFTPQNLVTAAVTTAASPTPAPAPAPATTKVPSSSTDDSDDDDYWQFNTDEETNDIEPVTAAATVAVATTANTSHTLPITTPIASGTPVIQVAGGPSAVKPPGAGLWTYVAGAAAMMLFMSL